jgi:hypothetical protein
MILLGVLTRKSRFFVGFDTERLMGLPFTGRNYRISLMTVHLKPPSKPIVCKPSYWLNRFWKLMVLCVRRTKNCNHRLSHKYNIKFYLWTYFLSIHEKYSQTQFQSLTMTGKSPIWWSIFRRGLLEYRPQQCIQLKSWRRHYIITWFFTTVFTKYEVDTKFTDLIDGVPDTLNTLKEIAACINNDAEDLFHISKF